MSRLWIIGCSVTHGIGVAANQRWGQLVSDQLNLPVIFLTAEGSSIEWAANQILQADIKTDDVVLWGLTSPNRFMYYNDLGQVQHILSVYYGNNPEFEKIISNRRLVDDNVAYKAINYVKQVQNFLNKIGCQYSIGYLLPGIDDHKKIVLDELANSRNFFVAERLDKSFNADKTKFLNQTIPNTTDMFIDVGTDGFHPGVLQHQYYANEYLNILDTSK